MEWEENLKDEFRQLGPFTKAELVPNNLVLFGFRGSIAHGMYVPNTDPNSIDDVDMMGVFMAPLDVYVGVNTIKETRDKFVGKWDVVSYEYRKFVKMLVSCNPNVFPMLWLKPEQYVEMHSYGKLLVENRQAFVSKKAYKSFAGYAAGQLARMEKYTTKGYMGEKRRALVDKFGYDCKNAAHCVRLLRMATEFLTTGELRVFRTEDAEELLDIKKGGWPLETVKAEAEKAFADIKAAAESSPLPELPDMGRVNQMVVEVLTDYVANQGKLK
jgi:hypothetical protein